MSTNFEVLVMIMKIILTKKVSYCSHYFSFGQHYSCNLTDRQAFFIMEASTDQKNFHVIMVWTAIRYSETELVRTTKQLMSDFIPDQISTGHNTFYDFSNLQFK